MPALAGSARLILSAANSGDGGGGVAWSTDGSKLACVVYDEQYRAFADVIDLTSDTSERIPLPGQRDRRFYLSWSPDERFLAYVDGGALDDDVNRLVVLRIADGVAHEIAASSGASWNPTWSPDSRNLYYVSGQGGATMDLWQQTLESDGTPVGAPSALTTGIGMRQSAVFSPAHDRLAYSQGRLVSNVWRVPLLMDRPASWADAEQLTFENAQVQFFDLSPDETRIALSSNRTGNFDLWLMPSTGGELTPLTTDPAPDWAPAWSPNAEQIAFYSFRTGDREIWVMPVAGGPARQITHDRSRNQFPSWSANGDEIVFSSTRNGPRSIWVQAADGSEPPRQLTRGNFETTPSVSPDGRLVVFNVLGSESGTWAIPFDGGDPSSVSPRPGRYPRWSRDSRSVFFIDAHAPAIWSVSVDNHEERHIAELHGKSGALGIFGLDVGRDYVYFLWSDDIGDIWVMDVVRE